MKALSTLSEILALAGSQFKIYDMSRCITPMSPQTFYAIETGETPYPTPIAGHARLAICFWSIQSPEQPYIWFLQFPVDEQSLLKLAARDQFLNLVISALGQELNQEPTDSQAKALANNPCIFHPNEEKLAYFNARLKVDLNLRASQYYEHTQAYLNGDLGWENWHTVALQGLADVIARLDREGNSQRLLKAFPHLNETMWVYLTQLMEHHSLNQKICHQLCEFHQQWMKERPHMAHLLLRAMASSPFSQLRQQALQEQLSQGENDEQTFVTIAGRLWRDLTNTEMNRMFFESLAQRQDPQLFEELFADLVAIPSLRREVLARLRDPQRSEHLAQAIGQLVNHTNG